MPDDLEDLTDVWIEVDAEPPVTHRITFFGVKPCPTQPQNPNARHLFGGAETICGIVVIPDGWPLGLSRSLGGHHIELLEEKPEVDCSRCLQIEGLRDLAAARELPELVNA